MTKQVEFPDIDFAGTLQENRSEKTKQIIADRAGNFLEIFAFIVYSFFLAASDRFF